MIKGVLFSVMYILDGVGTAKVYFIYSHFSHTLVSQRV